MRNRARRCSTASSTTAACATTSYVVATELEDVKVGDISYSAMRVTRVQSGNEETVIWVVDGVPTPIRMLQRENGEDTYDLRLVEYKGAQ